MFEDNFSILHIYELTKLLKFYIIVCTFLAQTPFMFIYLLFGIIFFINNLMWKIEPFCNKHLDIYITDKIKTKKRLEKPRANGIGFLFGFLTIYTSDLNLCRFSYQNPWFLGKLDCGFQLEFRNFSMWEYYRVSFWS